MRYSTYKFVKYRCWILGFLNIHFDFISKLNFWFRFILKDSGPMVVRRFSVQSGSDLAVILPVQFDSVITGFQVAISKYLSSGVNNTFGTGGFETFFCFWIFHFSWNFLRSGIQGLLGSKTKPILAFSIEFRFLTPCSGDKLSFLYCNRALSQF